MAYILALFFSLIVVGDIKNTSKKSQVEKVKAQVSANQSVVKKIIETEKTKTAKEVVKSIKPEPIKEEVNSIKLEPIKEEVNSIKPEPIKEEVKSIKPEPIKEEEVKEVINLNEDKTDWFKLFLYVLGFILFILSGKYLYSRFKKNSAQSSSNNYMRSEFKEETNQSETTDQEPVVEETKQSETTDQEPVIEDEDTNKQ